MPPRPLEDAFIEEHGITKARRFTLRSDNGIVFGSKVCSRLINHYGVTQEYITLYRPEQNGMIEWIFHTLKDECAGRHRSEGIDHAIEVIADWIAKYSMRRPHSTLGYLNPQQYRSQLAA